MEAIKPSSGKRYIDCTLGAGGHALGILSLSSPAGELLAFDLDPHAIEIARSTLKDFSGRFHIVPRSYTHLPQAMRSLGWDAADGILLDLGVSSMQLDQEERGFSFRHEGPLDMRFDPSQGESAAQLLARLDEEQLAEILWKYGEERHARQVARAICQERSQQELTGTRQLADLIDRAIGRRYTASRQSIHPATRSFQAIRIAVNHELEAIETVLPLAVNALRAGGRLAVISFHSLEDRLVKEFFRRERTDCLCPPRQPLCTCGHRATIKLPQSKPITARQDEIGRNPRSRSAKLRIAEKLP